MREKAPALVWQGQETTPVASDEDWSQIEDMATRRRLQNKAAQRKYRKCACSEAPTAEART